MSTKISLTPKELGQIAFEEVRGAKPLYDSEFCDAYLSEDYSVTERFGHMRQWFSGYKQASYDLYDKQKSKSKKASTVSKPKVIDMKSSSKKDDSLPF